MYVKTLKILVNYPHLKLIMWYGIHYSALQCFVSGKADIFKRRLSMCFSNAKHLLITSFSMQPLINETQSVFLRLFHFFNSEVSKIEKYLVPTHSKNQIALPNRHTSLNAAQSYLIVFASAGPPLKSLFWAKSITIAWITVGIIQIYYVQNSKINQRITLTVNETKFP